jgi:hypothetical protein
MKYIASFLLLICFFCVVPVDAQELSPFGICAHLQGGEGTLAGNRRCENTGGIIPAALLLRTANFMLK